MNIAERVVGSVIADENSPSFDIFKFKANTYEYVYPGTLVGTKVGDNRHLIGRVSAAIEINPHETAGRAKVREALDMEPDYPGEEFSTTIYRVYEVDIIEEAVIRQGTPSIEQPSNMPVAGEDVVLLTEDIVAKAMGFETNRDFSICLGTTQISENEDSKLNLENVLLNPKIIQRHIFIGGTTGSGKSFSTGILLEEVNRLGIPIIIIDSQKEYIQLVQELHGFVITPGDYTVRLSSLTENEVLNLVSSLEGTQGQNLLAHSFIRLKREVLGGSLAGFGIQELLSAMKEDSTELDIKGASLRLALSRTEASLEQHYFLGNKTNWVEALSWKHYKKATPILNINCNGLDQGQLQLVVAATLRELQTLRKADLIPPYLMVLDEAHLLVPEGETSACKQVIREGVRIGRHHGICMALITQSPVDIDKKTIRQCNTRLIFALEADQLDSIRGVRADATDEMLKRLPKMPAGTCLLSGTYETVKHAIPIRIRSNRKTTPGGQTPNIFTEVAEKWQKKT